MRSGRRCRRAGRCPADVGWCPLVVRLRVGLAGFRIAPSSTAHILALATPAISSHASGWLSKLLHPAGSGRNPPYKPDPFGGVDEAQPRIGGVVDDSGLSPVAAPSHRAPSRHDSNTVASLCPARFSCCNTTHGTRMSQVNCYLFCSPRPPIPAPSARVWR